MNRPHSLQLTRRLLGHVGADTTDLAPEPRVEPAEHFFDEARWQREGEQFFLETPQAIGFAGEVLEPESFLTCEVMGVPVSGQSGLLVLGVRPELEGQRVAGVIDTISSGFEGPGFEQMTRVGVKPFGLAAIWKLVVGLSHEALPHGRRDPERSRKRPLFDWVRAKRAGRADVASTLDRDADVIRAADR